MKTPHSTQLRYSAELISATNRLIPGSIAERQHKLGMIAGEPLIVALDALLRYAEAWRIRHGYPICKSAWADEWLTALQALRSLLSVRGAIAMLRDWSSDSKDNATLEALYKAALEMGGYTDQTTTKTT